METFFTALLVVVFLLVTWFAGFVVVFWIKAMRDELHEAQARDGKSKTASPAAPVTLPARLGAARSGGIGTAQASTAQDRTGQHGAGEEHEDEELAAYNAYLGWLNAEASRAGSRLAGRASRRQAAGWGVRAARTGEAAERPASAC